MSVFWYVDEGSRPARLEALITLIAIGRTLPGQPMGSTIIRQVEWWNRRVDHTPLPSGRPAQIRYRLRLRSSTPEERRAPGIEEAPSGAAHEGALNRWVGSRSYYSSGFAVILHGSLGLGFGRSQTPTNIVHYTFDDGWSDRDHETHRLAHELGHLLGLARIRPRVIASFRESARPRNTRGPVPGRVGTPAVTKGGKVTSWRTSYRTSRTCLLDWPRSSCDRWRHSPCGRLATRAASSAARRRTSGDPGP